MNLLPNELIHEVASLLPRGAICRFSQSNRDLNKALKPLVWSHVTISCKGDILAMTELFKKDNTIPSHIKTIVIRETSHAKNRSLKFYATQKILLQLLCLAVNVKKIRLEHFTIHHQSMMAFVRAFKEFDARKCRALEIVHNKWNSNNQLIWPSIPRLEKLTISAWAPTLYHLPNNIQELRLECIRDMNLKIISTTLGHLRSLHIFEILEDNPNNPKINELSFPQLQSLSLLHFSRAKFECPRLEHVHLMSVHQLNNISGYTVVTLALDYEIAGADNGIYRNVHRCTLTHNWDDEPDQEYMSDLPRSLPCVEELVIDCGWVTSNLQAAIRRWSSLKRITLTKRTSPCYGFVGFRLVYSTVERKVYIRG